ncbi:MAG: hypothetical protein HRT61_08310 [Ekhidna sp.]|nr:hypothetical protein [Ekhidna sp.]
MKYYLVIAFTTLILCKTQAQFFVQQLDQLEIANADEIYVVFSNGDTLTGEIRGAVYSDSLLTRFTLKAGDEWIKIAASDLQLLAIQPGLASNYKDIALLPIIRDIDNDDFIDVLPEDGWVFFERITLPGKRKAQALSQLLNPGFDQKLKIYKDPQSSNMGGSSINGLLLEGGLDDSHLVSIDGAQTFRIGNFSYRKKSLDLLYNDCKALADQKLRWKDFAKHVFTYDQKCLD